MADTSAPPPPADSITGSAKNAINQISNGPVAESVKDQATKTNSEFNNLANSRQTPSQPAATGQPLTHYHSFFFELLSWKNPRASGIAFASVVALIFAFRYLDLFRYSLRLTWMALAVTVLAEVVGKTLLSNGLASQLRPRKYYTIPRETLDAAIGDVHELINFFVIEAQRIFFAENVGASAAAAVLAFSSYYLIKIVPYWGLALITTCLAFVVPLIYTSNQELIDHHLKQAADVVNSQTEQFRQVASKHTAQATEIAQQYIGDYTAQAQQLLRGSAAAPTASGSAVPKDSDFPAVPKQDIKTSEPAVAAPAAQAASKKEEEPLIAA